MNWVVMAFLMLAVVGSMLWVMPSPRDRMQAALRQKAMQLGLQIQMTRLQCPRAIGEAEGEELDYIAYRLGRAQAGEKKAKITSEQAWQVFRLNSHATIGLPEGWCWGKGEKQLSEAQLNSLQQILEALPADIFSLESTPVAVAVFWRESGNVERVEQIQALLKEVIAAGL